MTIVASNWNVIVVGAWNRAILTPEGIRKRLFELPDNTLIQVEVAIDRVAPTRVRYDDLTVSPGPGLDISTDVSDVQHLEKASALALKALSALPETPVSAAGVNFRYQISEIPEALLALVEMPLTSAFADAGYAINEKAFKFALQMAPGVANIELTQGNDASGSLVMNFHMTSEIVDVLRQWLSRTKEFAQVTNTILSTLNLEIMEGGNAGV